MDQLKSKESSVSNICKDNVKVRIKTVYVRLESAIELDKTSSRVIIKIDKKKRCNFRKIKTALK